MPCARCRRIPFFGTGKFFSEECGILSAVQKKRLKSVSHACRKAGPAPLQQPRSSTSRIPRKSLPSAKRHGFLQQSENPLRGREKSPRPMNAGKKETGLARRIPSQGDWERVFPSNSEASKEHSAITFSFSDRRSRRWKESESIKPLSFSFSSELHPDTPRNFYFPFRTECSQSTRICSPIRI